MYFIESTNGLIGKEILYADMPKYAQEVIIVTKDKGVFVFDKDEEGIDVYNEYTARCCILNKKHVREELTELGVLSKEDIEEYIRICREKAERAKIERDKSQEAQQYQQYLRLKELYEGTKS